MAGCGNNKYTQSEFNALFSHILDGDYVDYINTWFDSDTANTLLKGISLNPNNLDAGLKSIDEIMDFLYNLDPEDDSEMEMHESSNPKYATQDDTVELTAYAEYVENGGVRTEYEQYVNDFKTQIVERTLLKDGKLVDPESVSENLYQYRLELVSDLMDYLFKGQELPNFASDEQFTRFVKTIIGAFSQKIIKDDFKNYSKYLGSFIKLKHFDRFLEDEIDFIVVKPEYSSTSTLGKDMYISSGPFNYKDRFASYSEEAGTEDYTSSFVKLLLWYYKVDGRPIGLDGFQAVSGKIMEWVEDSQDINLQEALYNGLDKSFDADGETAFGIDYLFNRFINAKGTGATPAIKNVARAIYENIFSKDSPLEDKIRKIFLNQFTTSVRYAYLAYRLKYDFDSEDRGPDAMRFISELLQSELVNRQTYNVQRAIKNRVYTLRHNPKLFDDLKEKYDIQITPTKIILNANGKSKVNLYSDSSFKESSYTINVSLDDDKHVYKFSTTGQFSSSFIASSFVKQFIEDVTGLTLPQDFANVFTAANPNRNIWTDFARIAGITLTASSTALDSNNVKQNLYTGYEYLYRGEELKLYSYYKDFEPLGNFFSVVYGSESATVIQNAEGNNLPTSQLRTSVFDVKRTLFNLRTPNSEANTNTQRSNQRLNSENEDGSVNWIDQPLGVNVFGENIIRKNPGVIGTIAMRSDTKLNDSSKVAQQLLPAEVLHQAIDVDFFSSLFGNNELGKNRIRRKERNATDVSIWLQPIVYSDKRTHFVIEFKIDGILLGKNKKALSDILQTIASFNPNRKTDISLIESEIKRIRLAKYEKQAENLISRFSTALNWNLSRNEGESIRSYFDRAKQKLKEFNQQNPENTLEKLENYFGTNVDIYNESDISEADNGQVFFNPTLDNQITVYSDNSAFDSRIKSTKINFIRDLIDVGYIMDPAINPNLRSEFKKLQTKDPTWFDAYDGTMKLFKATDSSNNSVDIDWSNIDDIDWNKINLELNPILESYFYADVLLSNQFSDLLFGDVNGYNAKHKNYKLLSEETLLNPNFIIEDESVRLADMAKRTVMAGASRITFAQGLKYGIDSHMKIAAIEDLRAPVFNFTGALDSKFKTYDGSTLCHPVFARLQNYSLLDRRVGNQRKKTFGNGLDPETGTAWELKHAEYTLTNEFRRNGEHTDFSYELLYKKMSSLVSEKLGKVNLSKYYGKTSYRNSDNENITCTKDIYRFNENMLWYEKLVRIEQNGKSVKAYWQAYNDNHELIPGGESTEDFELNTLYDLDQLFGGAYCAEWDNNTNRFKWSEINQDLLTIIVCEEDLKQDFIALAANHSSLKVGVKNLNRKNPAVYGNNDPLKYFEVSTLCYGIQMNPDHDIEDTHGVREMSQMISALIQGGYLAGDVHEIYRMIGEVALDSVRAVINAVERENQNEIYEIIGNALLKAFDTNQKSVLGLAQSFIAMANRDLANGSFKTRIPFSANTIKGSFQATITSFLNKDAIRRRYAGMGGINTPSHGGIQYFRYKNKNLTWIEFLREVGGKRNANSLLTDLSWNGVQFNNPSIVKINRDDIKLNDTIVYRDELGVAHPVKLNSPDLLYRYKYNENVGDIYLWTVKPRDLSGSEITFNVSGREFSIYDADLVRIISECQAIAKNPELFYTIVNDEIVDESGTHSVNYVELTNRGITYYNLLRNAFPDKNITIDDLLSRDNITDYFNQAKWDVINVLLPTLSKATKGEITIPIQECMKGTFESIEEWEEDWKYRTLNGETNVPITNAVVNALQVGIGKMSARKLGLQNGDTLNDVRTQKEQFFKNKLKKLTLLPSSVDSDFYDAILYGNDGTQTLVLVGGLDENSEKMNSLQENSNFKLRGKHYWRNGIDYGESKGKVFKEFIDNNGKTYDVVVVNSWNDFRELYSNGLYSNAVYNFTFDNWKNLLRFRYSNNFDKTGKLLASVGEFNGRPLVEQTEEGDLYSVTDEFNLIYELNQKESNRQRNFINRRANQMYEAFEMQLKVIIDRIPSQSMQSFTSADVAILLDTEENTEIMSSFLLWLQGADLDVDKSFTITYEISEDGRIIVPSKLNRYYNASQVLDLPLPDKRIFKFYNSDEYAEKVSNGELTDDAVRISAIDVANGINFTTIDRILRGSGKVVFDNDVNVVQQNAIEERIKLHQDSVNLPSSIKVAGYRNRIVHIMHKVLRDPIVQAQLNVPVDDAMSELKNAIPKPKYEAEFFRTWDNPAAKFRIQRDNMVGREVIGISAVSLKAFFAESAYGNQIINDILNLAQKYQNKLLITGEHDVELGNQIINNFKKICFDAKFKVDDNVKSGIATIGNLRFSTLLELANKLDKIAFNTNANTPRLKNISKKYVENGMLNIKQLVSDLNVYANGLYNSPKDAALTLSGYTSLATDNAKELQLVKMNATSKFADIHTYLTTIGVRPKDIIEFMASPAFNIVTRFAESTILDPNTSRFNVENSLKFITDEQCLPNIKDFVFMRALTTTVKNKSFLDLLETAQVFKIAEAVDPNINRVIGDKNEALKVISDAVEDKSKRLLIMSEIYKLLRNDASVENLLLTALRGGISNTDSRKTKRTYDEEELYENQFSEEDFIDDLDLEEQSYYNQDDYFNDWELKKEDWLEVYRYVKNYLIPKNRALRKLGPNVDSQYARLKSVLKAIKEQQMLGALCGINQGMDTGDYDEYNNVRKIEVYVNRKYREYLQEHPEAELERFNFIDFLSNDTIRDKQIQQYELVADTYNILDMITSIPHYNAMSKMISTNRYLIQRSVALKMERDLATRVLSADKPNTNGFTDGDVLKLNVKEWSAVRNYVNDLLILKWFEQQSNLSIKLPLDSYFYVRGIEKQNVVKKIDGTKDTVRDSVFLNTLDGLATFKRLMDTEIIPALKREFKDNAFIQDLIVGSIHNNILNRLQTFYRPSFDISQASKNPSLDLKYKKLSEGFNEIAKQYLPKKLSDMFDTQNTKWKIGDLFFIYNLYVHKDGFSSVAFTRFFEDSNTSADKFTYSKQYYDYLSKLDSREVNYENLFKDELYPSQTVSVLSQNDYLNDLRVRLADFDNAEYKFRVKHDGEGENYEVKILSRDGEERNLKFWNPKLDPSDFTLWFPYKLWKSGLVKTNPRTDKRLEIKKDSILSDITFEGISSSVISTMVDKLYEYTDYKVPVKLITNQQLEDDWINENGEIKFANENDFVMTRDAFAFVYNGTIYINTGKSSIDSPIHEFLHIIMAAMKYNGDQNVRAKYFQLLNEVVKQNNNRYLELQSQYNGRRDSDIKEELLAEVLSNGFATTFMEDWDELANQTNGVLKQSDLVDFTINFLNSIFGSEISSDIDALSLGNSSIRELLSLFGTVLNDTDKPSISEMILPVDQLVREIKAALFNSTDENNQITFSKDCI